jgi:hypothetical protein
MVVLYYCILLLIVNGRERASFRKRNIFRKNNTDVSDRGVANDVIKNHILLSYKEKTKRPKKNRIGLTINRLDHPPSPTTTNYFDLIKGKPVAKRCDWRIEVRTCETPRSKTSVLFFPVQM